MTPGMRTALGIAAVVTIAGGLALAMRRGEGGDDGHDNNEDGGDVPQNINAFGEWTSYSLPTRLALPSRPYKPGELVSVVTVHVTDVKGGFGLAKYQIDKWKKALAKGAVPPELLAQLADPENVEASARILALLDRYHGDAYHEMGSRVLGIVNNYPITLRTSHGHAGNMGPGWALDCSNTEPMTPALVEAGRGSLERIILATGIATGRDVVAVPHRSWKWPSRAQDPGAIVWREIVLPTLQATGAAAGYNTKGGTGKPIPISWDPNALFDDKGNPIKPNAIS